MFLDTQAPTACFYPAERWTQLPAGTLHLCILNPSKSQPEISWWPYIIKSHTHYSNHNSPLFTFKSEAQFQTPGFISDLIQKHLPEVSLCQWQVNHGCGGSIFRLKQTGRRYPFKMLSLWMQQFQDINQAMFHFSYLEDLLRMSSFPPPPTSPLSIWSANPCTYKRVTCSRVWVCFFLVFFW